MSDSLVLETFNFIITISATLRRSKRGYFEPLDSNQVTVWIAITTVANLSLLIFANVLWLKKNPGSNIEAHGFEGIVRADLRS